MARPIKETPTIYGEDARRFAQAMEHPRTVSVEDVRRLKRKIIGVIFYLNASSG